MNNAKEFLDKMIDKGYSATLERNFVVWAPTPPVDLILECHKYSNEIANILEKGKQSEG